MLHYFSMQYWAITQRHLGVCSPTGLIELAGEILHALLNWEEERGGLGSESCLHIWHHMWGSLTLFQPL